MRGIWLPGDETYPPRPDLPILRHITYDEIHAFQLGVVGLPIGAAYAEGLVEVSVWFTVAVMAIAMGVKRMDDEQDGLASGVIAEEPWYFTSAYFVWAAFGFICSRVAFPPPALPDPGTVIPAYVFVALAVVAVVIAES